MGTYDEYQSALTAEKERDKNTGQELRGGVQHTLANELRYLRGNIKQMTSQGGDAESVALIKSRYGLGCPGAKHRNMLNWEQKQLERTDSWPSPIYGRSCFVYLGVDRLWRSENHKKFKAKWGADIDKIEAERAEFDARAGKVEVEERKYCSVMALTRAKILISLGAPLNGQDTVPSFVRALASGFWGGAGLSPKWAAQAKKELIADAEQWMRLADALEEVEQMQLEAWRKAGWGWQGDQKPAATPERYAGVDKIEQDVVTDSSVPMIIQHCQAHRDKWTEHENPAHNQRWNHVIELILAGEVENAAGYAKQWAAKGWSPWQKLVEMLEV